MPSLLSSLEESFVSLSIRVEVLRHIYNLIVGDFRMFIKVENLWFLVESELFFLFVLNFMPSEWKFKNNNFVRQYPETIFR